MNSKIINNIRVVTMEMISNVKSGHPGIALGAAPIMHTLYGKVLKQTANDSKWINRDRFVMAAGHGSSLLYAVLHLAGYNVTINDLKNFRQLGSITPGHPELYVTEGVDASSGPLGQGIAMACGMALSERVLADRFNKPNFNVFNHYTYVLCGDGDLQEGVTLEALSLIGHLNLNKMIILYDSNDIQLDGEVNKCNTENTQAKIEAMNFNYLKVIDGENTEDLLKKIEIAKASSKPTFIEIKTVIGYSSSVAGSSKSHGSPLAMEEVLKMRDEFGGEQYSFTDEAYNYYANFKKLNDEKYDKYQEMLLKYKEEYADLYNELINLQKGEFNISYEDLGIKYDENYTKATRYAAGDIFKKLSELCPTLIGGSADLACSTQVTGIGNRRIDFGVREHAMAAICNGITAYGMTKAFCSGFFVFSDYCKPAIRMSALMELPVMYCFSHDSIAVGEDGPTHQPIEQLTMLRSIPNVNVIRPCGLSETIEACLIAFNSDKTPTVICTSRQNINEVRKDNSINYTSKGAYVISKENKELDAVIIATGSEVELAVNIQKKLLVDGIDVRVVSMPSIYLFEKQNEEYKEEVLPNVSTFAIEMSEAAHMYKYIKGNGRLYNINTFGVSAKASDVFKHFGFTVENIKNRIKEDLQK